MGKIRVKTLGVEELEEDQKKETKKRKEAKELKKTVKAPGLKGGERVVAVGPTEEELAKIEKIQKEAVNQLKESQEPKKKEKKNKPKPARIRSKSYQARVGFVDKTKKYALSEALSLLPKLKGARFDETVELHFTTTEPGVNAMVTLPYGTGKIVRVAIADEPLIKEIEKGKITFDVLLSTPAMMPQLAKVARVLGPRGLMPNPKNGTIATDPQKTALQFQKGQITLKTEAKFPLMHVVAGKLSFGDKKLLENIEAIFKAFPASKIKKAILKSTMSPSIPLEIPLF